MRAMRHLLPLVLFAVACAPLGEVPDVRVASATLVNLDTNTIAVLAGPTMGDALLVYTTPDGDTGSIPVSVSGGTVGVVFEMAADLQPGSDVRLDLSQADEDLRLDDLLGVYRGSGWGLTLGFGGSGMRLRNMPACACPTPTSRRAPGSTAASSGSGSDVAAASRAMAARNPAGPEGAAATGAARSPSPPDGIRAWTPGTPHTPTPTWTRIPTSTRTPMSRAGTPGSGAATPTCCRLPHHRAPTPELGLRQRQLQQRFRMRRRLGLWQQLQQRFRMWRRFRLWQQLQLQQQFQLRQLRKQLGLRRGRGAPSPVRAGPRHRPAAAARVGRGRPTRPCGGRPRRRGSSRCCGSGG